MATNYEPTRSPARALQIIYEIATSANGLSLARLTALTRLPKTSLLSLLRSLEASSYVVNVSGVYRLGQGIFAVAEAVTSKQRFLPAARPVLQMLHEETGETVQLGILADDEPAAESVEVIETHKPIRLSFPVGLRRPLHCSSIGKLLLAYQSAEWIEHFLATNTLVAYTPQTITGVPALREELAAIRATGLSISHQGMFEDASGLSAPIWNAAGAMVAGVSLTAPTYRVMRDEERIRQLVRSAGEDISRRLGYEGAYPKQATPADPSATEDQLPK